MHLEYIGWKNSVFCRLPEEREFYLAKALEMLNWALLAKPFYPLK